MDRESVRDWLTRVTSASTPPTLDEQDVEDALDASRIVDLEGRAPVHEDYVPTFDRHYAAALLFDLKADLATVQDQGGLESFSSEGTTFRRRPGTSAAGFRGLAVAYRGRSTVAESSAISVINLVPEDAFTPRSLGREATWT